MTTNRIKAHMIRKDYVISLPNDKSYTVKRVQVSYNGKLIHVWGTNGERYCYDTHAELETI